MSIETEVEKQAVDNVYDENVAKACKHQNSGIYIIFEREIALNRGQSSTGRQNLRDNLLTHHLTKYTV